MSVLIIDSIVNDLKKRKKEERMKPQMDTYENLVQHYNRDYSPFIECECGKYIQEKYKEKHEKTKLHFMLLDYKIKCKKLKEEQNLHNKKEQEYGSTTGIVNNEGHKKKRRNCGRNEESFAHIEYKESEPTATITG